MTKPVTLTQSDLDGMTDNQQFMLIDLIGHEGHVTTDVERGKMTMEQAAEVLRRALIIVRRKIAHESD